MCCMGTFVFEMSKDKNDTALPPFLVVVEIKNVLAQNLMRVLGHIFFKIKQ